MLILIGAAFGSVVALFLIWLGYPVAIWLAAKVAGQPNVPDLAAGATRRVSVVLATRDGASVIRNRIDNLLETAHPAELLEIVVALDADGATATLALLGALDTRVLVVSGDAPGGKASTLNAGVRAATGEILVMADVAQRFDVQTISHLVAALEDPRFGAVSGALDLGREGRRSPVVLYWGLEKWLRHYEAVIHSSIGVTGAVYATRRALWTDLPAGTLLDDVYVPMSLALRGHRIAFSYSAKASDLRTFESNAEGQRKARTLTGVIQLVSLLPELTTSANPVRLQFMMHKLARLTTPLWFAVLFFSAFCVFATLAIRYPLPILLTVTAASATIVGVPILREKVFYLFAWFIALQLATVTAIGNGLRGKWSVWHRDSK